MTYLWHDIVGNLGVLLLLSSYFLLQIERLSARSITYSLVNALGAGMILVSLLVEFNLSAFVVELTWLLISVYGVIRRMFPCAAE